MGDEFETFASKLTTEAIGSVDKEVLDNLGNNRPWMYRDGDIRDWIKEEERGDDI